MKLTHLAFSAIAIMVSCKSSDDRQEPWRLAEGTYVLQSKSEFSVADDTLVIKPVIGQKGLFSIKRNISYQRTGAKGEIPREKKQEVSTAIWEPETTQLKEQKHGRFYSVSADGNQLLIGKTVYRKVVH